MNKPNLRQRIGQFITGKKEQVVEIIGRWTFSKPLWQSRILLSKDTTSPDYVFWDSLRRGKAPGYEIGGLFATPIAQTIASYVFGDGISASLVETVAPDSQETISEDGKRTQDLKAAQDTTQKRSGQPPAPGMAMLPPQPKPEVEVDPRVAWTNMQLRRMMERNQGFFVSTIIDAYCLSEQYVFVNPDCTFSVASPETVTCEYSASDYRRLLKVIVRTKYQGSLVTDEYTDDKRTVTIHYYDGRADVVQEYENLIGRIPMVHFANDRAPNEIHGRVLFEPALPVMAMFDNVTYKTVAGVDLLGNPIPIFENLDNPTETLQLNSTQETYIDEQGNQQVRNLLRFDRNAGIFLGKGGAFKFGAPPVGFTKDNLDVLRQLFLLLLNHTRIPEYAWGGAISSSKASAEVQAPPFTKYIKFRRLMLEGEGADPELGISARGGFLALIDIWLRMYKLLNPAIVVGAVRVEWPEIDTSDALVKYQWGTFLSSTGKITDESAIRMSGYFENPAAEVAAARGDEARRPEYDKYDKQLRKARLEAARKSMEPDNDDGEPFATDYIWTGGVLKGEQNPWSIVGPQVWENETGGGYER